jgi:hypothetical protein
LCAAAETALFLDDSERLGGRRFFRCPVCRIIAVGQDDLPDRATERKRYLQHNNDVDDPDYRAFLARLWDPVRLLLSDGATGLDYGAGPGPALVAMMRQDGFVAEGYDPIFAPQTDLLKRKYGFIVCTETFEHMHRPGDEFSRLDGLIRPGGLLGVMTAFAPELEEFENWYYRRDPTHVAFYSAETMKWIAGRMSWRLELPARDVAIFHKPVEQGHSSLL